MRKIIFIHLLLLLAISCQNSPTSTVSEAEAKTPIVEAAAAPAAAISPTAPTPEPQSPSVNSSPAAPKNATGAHTKPAKNAVVEKASLPALAPSVEKSATPKPDPKPIAEQPKAQPAEAKDPPSHDAWDKLLQQYVTADGKVNYGGLKKDKAKLEAYLKTLEENPPQDGWSRGEKMAFWINAYNAATIKLIVDNYPVSSITKLEGGKPWDVKRVKIGGKAYSLDAIENDILRPQFKDPRIHFAVNCAAQSCPPLLNRAWTAANLESNFEKQAKAFINNSRFNKISAKSVQVSKIFEWYGSDFGNLVTYLNKYATTKINAGAKVAFLEYDWALNQQ